MKRDDYENQQSVGKKALFMKLFFKINWTASLTEKVYNV